MRCDFRFGPKVTKETGDVFTERAFDGVVRAWRVVRERLELRPFAGGQRIYTCERIVIKELPTNAQATER